jgi:hypothetical protein
VYFVILDRIDWSKTFLRPLENCCAIYLAQ